MILKERSYPQETNPLPQTPTPRGLRPLTAELRLSSAKAPLRSATPKRKEGFALFSLVDHSLRSWSTALTPCPHLRVKFSGQCVQPENGFQTVWNHPGKL